MPLRCRVVLHGTPYAQRVAAENLFDRRLVVAAAQQSGDEVRVLAHVLEPARQRIAHAVEVGAQNATARSQRECAEADEKRASRRHDDRSLAGRVRTAAPHYCTRFRITENEQVVYFAIVDADPP